AMSSSEITLSEATQALGPLRDELAGLRREQVKLDRLAGEEAQAAERYYQAQRMAERAAALAVLDSRGLDNLVIIDPPEVGLTPLGLSAPARVALAGLLGLIVGLACACLID